MNVHGNVPTMMALSHLSTMRHTSVVWGTMLLLVFAIIGHASGQSCVPSPAGVVSWWPGEGDAEDITGGHDGTLEGGATFVAGKVGQALSFDGVDDSLATSLILPSVCTIELWVNPTSLAVPSSTQILLGTHGTANGDDRLWLVSSGPAGGPGVAPNTLVVNVGSHVTNDLVIPNPLSVGTWTHLALTFDYGADVYQLYVNGLLAATATAQRNAPTQAFRIGGGTSDFGQTFLFHGALDEVTVYNRALAASEIQAIFEASSAGKCQPVASCLGTGPAFLGGWVKQPTGGLIPSVTLTLSGPGCHDTLTTATGFYLLPYLGNGTYTVIPTKTGCTFTPPAWTGTIVKRMTLALLSGTCP